VAPVPEAPRCEWKRPTYTREWERLSRLSLGQPRSTVRPREEPRAKGLPPLATVSPRPAAFVSLPVLAVSRDRPEKGELLMPSGSSGPWRRSRRAASAVRCDLRHCEVRRGREGCDRAAFRDPARTYSGPRPSFGPDVCSNRIVTSIPVVRSVLARRSRRGAGDTCRALPTRPDFEPTKVYDRLPARLSGGCTTRDDPMALAGIPP